jgi:phosphatidylinositol alpha 1,6-mannosyltransferase
LLAGLDRIPGLRLVVTGDGPQRSALERKLRGATFLGFQTGAELSKVHASADIFVHTGSHETFCQAAQEALSSGVPAVVPAAGGLLDLVEHGRSGLHFTPGNAEHLRASVLQIAADPAMRMRMSREARRSVEHRSWSVIGDELLNHYDEVAA